MLLALGSVAPVAAQSSVRVGYMPIAEELPKMVANEKGFFKKRGLNAELVRFESGPDMGTALLGGSIQIGMIGTPGLINAAVAGRPLVAIVDNGSNVAARDPRATNITPASSSSIIPRSREHRRPERKKIAINVLKANLRGADRNAGAPMLEQGDIPTANSITTKDIQFITIPFGSMPVALEQGRVDAASMIEPFMTQLTANIRCA